MESGLSIHPYNRDSGYVYRGVWTNYSHGTVVGLTLTLNQKHGAIITAFVAVLVTFTGRRFWKVLRLFLHQRLSSEKPEDAIYHQRQAILRNSDSSAEGLWQLMRQSWAWSGGAWKRNAGLLLLTTINTAFFIAASILSSQVTYSAGNNEVLIQSRFCGRISSSVSTSNVLESLNAFQNQRYLEKASYSDSCYDKETTSRQCGLYKKKRLEYTMTRNIPCPFPGGENLCMSKDSGIRLDSGLINSNDDLGVNSPPEQRFAFRTVAECTMLKTNNFTINETRILPGSNAPHQYATYLYGESLRGGNVTWQVPLETPDNENLSKRYKLRLLAWRRDYDNSLNKHNMSVFWPISELRRDDADGSIAILASGDIPFLGPVDDPWFSAHRYSGRNVSERDSVDDKSAMNTPLYYSDDPARALGCTQQWQICNPNLPKDSQCTPLSASRPAVRLVEKLWRGKMQRDLFEVVYNPYHIMQVAGWLEDDSLLARKTLGWRYQGALPDTQWQLEVEHWFKYMLAAQQITPIDYAAGSSDARVRKFWVKPQTAAQNQVCERQIIRSDGFTSFNLFGLIIILTLSGSTIILSFILPSLVESIANTDISYGKKKYNTYKSLEWTSNSVLQLQRLAHEAVGSGNWLRTAKEYPTAERDQTLALLDITDSSHPILVSRNLSKGRASSQ